MTEWKCNQCGTMCTFDRNTTFPPERCVYNERGGDRKAIWVKTNGN